MAVQKGFSMNHPKLVFSAFEKVAGNFVNRSNAVLALIASIFTSTVTENTASVRLPVSAAEAAFDISICSEADLANGDEDP